MLLLGCFARDAHAGDVERFRTVQKPVPGRYIVVLKPEAARLTREQGSKPSVRDLARGMSGQHGATLLRDYGYALRGFAVRAGDEALARLIADPRVAYVEEDGVASIYTSPAYPVPQQLNAPWGLDRIDQRPTAGDGTYSYATLASNVHAYVIDTGIRSTHAEFGQRVGEGFTPINDGRGTSDCHGHGTHVAGTIGGATYGVAKGVQLHPVRVLGCDGAGTWSDIIAGVDWVAAHHLSPAVANLSLGGPASDAVDTAVANLVASGVTVVVAAGNAGGDACYFSPARAPAAITVGSTRNDDGRSYFSNYGSCVDLFAPGSSILSASNASDTSSAVMSGTSMAAPHVAGVAAMILADMPTLPPADVAQSLRNSATKSVLGAGTTAWPLLYTFGGPDPTSYPTSGAAPVITSFKCPSQQESGSGFYTCTVTYTSSAPAVVIWPGPEQDTTYARQCAPGNPVGTITVTVANRFGMATRTSASFSCPSGSTR